jgi:uncharacterized Fe-S cluster-containing protein
MDNCYSNGNLPEQLPGLNCGLCGEKTCEQFARRILEKPREIEKCIHLSSAKVQVVERKPAKSQSTPIQHDKPEAAVGVREWKDSLGREYDFILESFPDEPGPREIILPHNPARTQQLDIKVGDTLIGRPMGMSCGCPITHCGTVMNVDAVNGVIVWSVTGPLGPRSGNHHKDIGYYSAQAYEGIVTAANKELKIGMRYWFLPRRCMLQWRHSGLVNLISKTGDGLRIRVEGLMIG